MLLSSTYYNSAGQDRLYFKEFDSPATNYGIAWNADSDEAHQFFADISYRDFRLQSAYGSRTKNIPTGAFASVFGDPGTKSEDTRAFVDLQYSRNFGADWGVQGRVYYDRYTFHGTDILDLSSLKEYGFTSRSVNHNMNYGQWWGAELTVSKKLFDNQTLILGSEFIQNFQQDQDDFFVQPNFPLLNSHKRSTIAAVYAQDDIPLRHDLTLSLGLRHDQYSTFGGTTNPRAALIYHPLENTTVKLLYGQSFRAPTAYEMYFRAASPVPGASPINILANPNLRPETAKTTEVVLEQYFNSHYLLTASGYFYPIRRLVTQQFEPTAQALIYDNSGRVNLQGLEVSLRRKSESGLEAGLGLSLEDAKNVGAGGPLTNSPRWLGQANLSVPMVHRKVFASMGLNYVSRRETLAGNYTQAYAMPDFTLFSRALKHWDISASLYDAFGCRHGDPGSGEDPEDIIMQDGRTFRLKFTYHF